MNKIHEKKATPAKILDKLRSDYSKSKSTADRLLLCLKEQISSLIDKNGIALGVPMEARVKNITSVEDKIKRKSKSSLSDIDDLVGIRLIVLFQKDIETMDEIVKSTFSTISFEDTSTRLETNQFGYQSNHYVVKIPNEWLAIPSYADLGEISAEIQVRTLAQHIWAAASHKLQYKREESVPPPLLRSINRVSALLETVDLEFSRLLNGREAYVEEINRPNNQKLNVDLISKELMDFWPLENLSDDEQYDELLSELSNLGIENLEELQSIINKHKITVLDKDKISHKTDDEGDPDFDQERHARGVYFTHVGLTRTALQEEFGMTKFLDAMKI